MRAAPLLLLVAACSFHAGGAPDGGGPTDDATDALGLDACATFASQFDTCLLAPGAAITFAGALTYNTDTGAIDGGDVPGLVHVHVASLGDEVDAIVAAQIAFAPGASLRAVGSRPLALVSWGDLSLASAVVIDVSAHATGPASGAKPAGARASCETSPMIGHDSGDGAGGGGGGGYGAGGGNGGRGNSDHLPLGHDVDGGPGAAGVPMPAGPRGGCPGAPGGRGDVDGGVRGEGGGAIYVVAAGRIALEGGAGIDAGGGGGGPGGHSGSSGDAGGGGGGTGGMILVEAREVAAPSGVLAANGGGGGGGSCEENGGGAGTDGQLDANPAAGGPGGLDDNSHISGTPGGVGGAAPSPGGQSVGDVNPGGGGGGGGSVGFLRVIAHGQAAPAIGVASPAPIP